jgi:hypothetical protein
MIAQNLADGEDCVARGSAHHLRYQAATTNRPHDHGLTPLSPMDTVVARGRCSQTG